MICPKCKTPIKLDGKNIKKFKNKNTKLKKEKTA